jgi:hypothetical protein
LERFICMAMECSRAVLWSTTPVHKWMHFRMHLVRCMASWPSREDDSSRLAMVSLRHLESRRRNATAVDVGGVRPDNSCSRVGGPCGLGAEEEHVEGQGGGYGVHVRRRWWDEVVPQRLTSASPQPPPPQGPRCSLPCPPFEHPPRQHPSSHRSNLVVDTAQCHSIVCPIAPAIHDGILEPRFEREEDPTAPKPYPQPCQGHSAQ